MKEHLAVSADTTSTGNKAWAARMRDTAFFATQQCEFKSTVHSAFCTIQGTPEKLGVNLTCTAKSEEHVTALMQYVNDTLLPQMEQALGIQFEVRNLQFAVAGRENLLPQLERLQDSGNADGWLDDPFATPALTATEGLRPKGGGRHTDLSMA